MTPSGKRSDAPLQVNPSTTAEMLAALPAELLRPEGTDERGRLSDVLRLYRAVFLNASEPIAIIDRFGQYLEQNAAHQRLVGYSNDELRGRTPAIHLGEETFASIADELARTGVSRREVTSQPKSGGERIIELSAFTVRDRDGQPLCYVGIKRDVTAQRQAANELERRFGELQLVYRMADSLGRARALDDVYNEAITGLLSAVGADRAAILLFDDDGVMRFKAWRGLSPVYRSAVEGHSPWKRDTRDPRSVTVADVRGDPKLAALESVITGEGIRSLAFIPLLDESGLLGKFMLYFDRPHLWADAELRLAETIARHVAFAIARQRRDAQLRSSVAMQERLANEASEANRTKSVFLATMSHELRTPLNAIAGYTDLLDAGVHGPLSPAQRDAVQRVQANQRHLLRLIDDVLDFAKLEAGHLTMEITDVPVQEALDGTRVMIEPQLRAKDITFTHEPGDPQLTCRADRAKLQQVVANLLSNAWKFTPPGGSVTLAWDATDECVRIHVRDSGGGIPATSIESIFAPFVQLQSGFRRRVEGTGLGLSISRELARAMGGDVTATSALGEGSTFTLTLPRHVAPPG